MSSHLQAVLTWSNMDCTGTPKQLDGKGRQGGSGQQVKGKAHVTLYAQQLMYYGVEEVLPC